MGIIKRMDQIKNILRTCQSTESIKAGPNKSAIKEVIHTKNSDFIVFYRTFSNMDNSIIDGFLVPKIPARHQRTGMLEDGRLLEFTALNNFVNLDIEVTLEGEMPPDGRYTLADGLTRYEIIGGKIDHEYYVEKFGSGEGEILVDCSRINGFGKGCLAYNANGDLQDGVYKLGLFKWMRVTNGEITQTSMFRLK